MHKLYSNLLNGLRLMLGRPVGKQHFTSSLALLTISLVISVALFAGFDYFLLDNIRFQDIRGSALLAAFFGIALVLCVVAAHLENDYPQLPTLLTILLSCLPWTAVLLSLFPYNWAIEHQATWPLFLLLAYCSFVVVRSLNASFYRPRVYTLVIAVAGLFFVATHSWNRYYFPAVFDSYDPAQYEESPGVDLEYTLYQQQRLVDEQLEQIEPSSRGTQDYFFLGFGGSDRQTVFETETLYAANLINSLYATGNRSLVLFNNVDKLEQQPIANTYNARHAVTGIAKKMNRDEDVLILLLTSHGSQDAHLAVDLEYLELKQLSANELKATLDEAQVKWRIIILSACYSGSFVDTLKDNNSLIITAASADRSSFGCSSERELTVFGEALFKNALNEDSNWVTAFTEAQQLIRAWETETDVPYSNPQISVGHDIRLKLGLPLPPVSDPELAAEPSPFE